MTAQEKILAKALVTNGLSSSEIDGVLAGFKDRAFFSAKVESVRYLQTAHQQVADFLSSAKRGDGALTTRASAISAIMDRARTEGITTGTGNLTDPGSVARAKVIVDTNADLARGYVSHVQQSSTGARLSSPALELVRLEEREHKREWIPRWIEAGGQLYGGRMIALKESPVWVALSRFGCPYPPFDYGSGMGTRSVDYDTCVLLGVITEAYRPEGDLVEDFNKTLEAQMEFKGTNDPLFGKMKDWFGDQILFDKGENKIRWQADLITRKLEDNLKSPGSQQSVILGMAPKVTSDKYPELAGKRLSIPSDELAHIYDRHVVGIPDKDSIRITKKEMELIPSVWRSPDDTIKMNKGIYWSLMASSDGNPYVLVVQQKNNGGLIPVTFFKRKQSRLAGLPLSGSSVDTSSIAETE